MSWTHGCVGTTICGLMLLKLLNEQSNSAAATAFAVDTRMRRVRYWFIIRDNRKDRLLIIAQYTQLAFTIKINVLLNSNRSATNRAILIIVLIRCRIINQ